VAAAGRAASGTAIASVVFVLLVAGIAYRYWPSDERHVRRHLIQLAEALSVPGVETEVARLTRVAVLREFFAPDVVVVVDGREIVSGDVLIATIVTSPPPPGGFSVEFVDETIALAPDRVTAHITLTARVLSRDLATGQALVDARDLTVAMTKAGGDWVIARAETVSRP
jgi:hypothetical protein